MAMRTFEVTVSYEINESTVTLFKRCFKVDRTAKQWAKAANKFADMFAVIGGTGDDQTGHWSPQWWTVKVVNTKNGAVFAEVMFRI